MERTFAKAGFDLGIVTFNDQQLLTFYRDVVGLSFEATLEMNSPLLAKMHRLWAGDSLLKIVVPAAQPDDISPPMPGGINGGTGMRYFTLSVDDIDAILADCLAAGANIAVPKTEVRPGVVIAMVEDPDRNWVEFLQT